MVDVIGAPVWAQDGKRLRQTDGGRFGRVPSMLADFATAIAKRYSGRFGQLPARPLLADLERAEPEY